MKLGILIYGKNNFISLLIFSLVTITCLSGLAGATSTISIVPDSELVAEGQKFAVNVYFEPDRPVAAIQFDLLYDSHLVDVISVSEGDLLGQDGALVLFNPGEIDNTNGVIDSVYGVILDKTSITDPGYFSVIQMSAGNVSGTSRFSLSNVVVSDTQGQIVPTEIVDGSITISYDTSSSGELVSNGGGDEAFSESGTITAISDSYEKVEAIERKRQPVYMGSQVSYQFDSPANPIKYVNYEALINAGIVTVTIEVLNGPSRFVSSEPPGTVYKNINIWPGKPGYGTEKDIKDAVIGFRIDNSWFEENHISDSSVMLYRYEQDTWIPLPTTKISETSSYVNYESSTTEFSPFVIVGDISEEVIAEVAESPEDDKGLGQNAALILCLSLIALLFARRR